MLNYLNGDNEIGKIKLLNKLTTAKNNAIQKLPKGVKKLVDAGEKVAKVGIKISATPMRLAFLGLVRINALKLATKLTQGIKKDRKKIEKFWTNFGGQFKELINTINLGAKNKGTNKLSGLGVAVETAVATATPITAALLKLLKDIGLKAGTEALQVATDKAKESLTNAITNNKPLPEGVETALVVENKQPTPEAETKLDKPIKEAEKEITEETKKSNMPLIIGSIAVLGLGAFLLMKKKK